MTAYIQQNCTMFDAGSTFYSQQPFGDQENSSSSNSCGIFVHSAKSLKTEMTPQPYPSPSHALDSSYVGQTHPLETAEMTADAIASHPIAPIVPPTFSSMAAPLAPLLLLLLLLTFLLTLRSKLTRHSKTHSYLHPFPPSTNLPATIPLPPHPLFNHLPNIFSPPDSPSFNAVVTHHANEAGISTFWFLRNPSVSILKAEHVRNVLRHSVERRTQNIFVRHFKKSLGSESIVIMNCDGGDIEKWRRHRNLVKGAFTSGAVQKMAGKTWRVANRFVGSILDKCKEESGSRGTYQAEALEIFKWATLDVFGSVALDYDFACTKNLEQTPLATSLDFAIEDSNTRVMAKNLLNPLTQLYWMPTKRNQDLARHSKNVRELIYDICEKKMEGIRNESSSTTSSSSTDRSRNSVKVSEDDDMLTILLKSQEQENQTHRQHEPHEPHEPSKPTNKNDKDDYKKMVEMLMTLFFAGYDTSSIGLTYAMYSISQHSRIQDECAKEVRQATFDMDSDPSQWETQLAYCWAVVMETMRMHPPVFNNARNMTKEITLEEGDKKYTLPSGTRVYIPIIQVHTYEKNFSRPWEFLPERWVRKDESTGKWVARDYHVEMKAMEARGAMGATDTNHTSQHDRQDYQDYIPPANPNYLFTFSDGARNCVGRRLALQESTMLLACIVRDLVVETRPGYVMQKRKKFAMAPPTEMPLLFRRRV